MNNEEDDDDDDGVSLAPDELVIMEEDPEYMNLFADEVDEQTDDRSSRSRDSRRSSDRERKGPES